MCRQHGIVVTASQPLGGGDRPARDRSSDDPASPLTDPTIVGLARGTVSAAQVILKWHIQRGIVAIPKGVNDEQVSDNLRSLELTLSDAEMRTMNALDRNHRLTKGQVFSWVQGQNWKELWDEQ